MKIECTKINALADEIAVVVTLYLTVPEQLKLMKTCRYFHQTVKKTWKQIQSLQSFRNGSLYPISQMTNLREISFENCQWLPPRNGGDLACEILGANCPLLSRINFSKVKSISDKGCLILSQGCPYIQYVDLTFCISTTYLAVLIFRGVSDYHSPSFFETLFKIKRKRSEFQPGCVFVRRQPHWIDGHYICPWGEVHTYYPDGSFMFDRDSENEGYVRYYEEREDHVADSLQYINRDMWVNVSTFHPGVVIKYVNDEEVLVVQNRFHAAAPETFPDDDDMKTIETLAVGQCITFSDQLLISRMKKTPLSPEELFPPHDLLRRICEFTFST